MTEESLERRMEPYIRDAVYLACCGAAGQVPCGVSADADWEKILRFSAGQKTEAHVYLALKKEKCGCPAEAFSALERRCFGRMLKNQLRREALDELLREAGRQGIRAAVMKGSEIADCYSDPDARRSNDIDLYVPREDAGRLGQMLLVNGKLRHSEKSGGHYAEVEHDRLGNVELHTALSEIYDGCAWFKNGCILNGDVKLNRDGDKYRIDPTAHFAFICLHCVRHFISGGISLQMCLDNILYYRAHRDEIRIADVEDELKRVDGIGLIRALAGIPAACGFDAWDAPFAGNDSDTGIAARLLEDMELGRGEKHADEMTLLSRRAAENMKYAENGGKSTSDRMSHIAAGLKSNLLPERPLLRTLYPDRSLPNAYAEYVRQRIITHIMRRRMARENSDAIEAETYRRVSLMRDTGML